MGVENEKERISAEVIRTSPASPVALVLPTVNPAVEKKEVPASKLHPAFYVMYLGIPPEMDEIQAQTYTNLLVPGSLSVRVSSCSIKRFLPMTD